MRYFKSDKNYLSNAVNDPNMIVIGYTKSGTEYEIQDINWKTMKVLSNNKILSINVVFDNIRAYSMDDDDGNTVEITVEKSRLHTAMYAEVDSLEFKKLVGDFELG